jgi:hypothetical protein
VRVREWIEQAGLAIEEEGPGSGFHHFVMRKDRAIGRSGWKKG